MNADFQRLRAQAADDHVAVDARLAEIAKLD